MPCFLVIYISTRLFFCFDLRLTTGFFVAHAHVYTYIGGSVSIMEHYSSEVLVKCTQRPVTSLLESNLDEKAY